MDRTTIAAIAAAGVALWLLRPKATVTTDEQYDLPRASYTPVVQDFARAISRAEGFNVAGSIPQRAKNPGNLKLPGYPTIGGGISVFDSIDQGWAALHNQLQLIIDGRSRYYNLDMTIKDMGDLWEADPGDAWANNVAADLGVSVNAPLWQVLV
jgi:hypothetical protein